MNAKRANWEEQDDDGYSSSGSDVVISVPSRQKTVKEKKPRSEAQINATKKAFEALQAKRQEKWEQKKQKMIETIAEKVIKKKHTEPEEKVVKEEKQVKPVVKETPKEDSMPMWAYELSKRIDNLATKEKPRRKKVIIEESDSSSEEEVIVKRKKSSSSKSGTKEPPTPPPVAAINYQGGQGDRMPPTDNDRRDAIRRMLYRH